MITPAKISTPFPTVEEIASLGDISPERVKDLVDFARKWSASQRKQPSLQQADRKRRPSRAAKSR